MDGRYIGLDRNATGDESGSDPSNDAIKPAFNACIHDYIKTELGYATDRKYYLNAGVPGFAWRYPENAMGDTSEMLRAAISANPYMRVVCFSGYCAPQLSFCSPTQVQPHEYACTSPR